MNTLVRPMGMGLLVLVLITTLCGCASTPAGQQVSGRQIVFTLKVRGQIDTFDDVDGTQRYYFIAIDNDRNTNTYPVAVYFPPYGGNGWVTSDDAEEGVGLTSFVQYDPTTPGGLIWSVLPGSNFLNTVNPRPPIAVDILDGGSTLRVIVDFSQMATDTIPVDQITQLNVNFITTNALPRGGQWDTVPYPGRVTDGLGPTGRGAISFDTSSDRLISVEDGSPANPFEAADTPAVTDPDLDIVYASVEIQTL